jgi:hypothetical protein
VNITENTVTTGGYSVQTLNWNDLDGDTEQTFAIVDESTPGVFEIENGTLTTNATLDFETETSYTVTIRLISTGIQ